MKSGPPVSEGRQGRTHVPVLRGAVVHFLSRPTGQLLDATVGDGSHAAALLDASGPTVRLLGIDLDPAALEIARRSLTPYGDRVRLVHGSFADLARLAHAAGVTSTDGILFDLGLRSGQLDASRGFSFRVTAPLDMRFDPTGSVPLPVPAVPALQKLADRHPAYTAADVLSALRSPDLADLFRRYADERYADRIAHAITRARQERPIRSTSELVRVVVGALPPHARHRRIHAATRIFQALRIAVNREVESLELGIQGACALLAPGGRLAVISYHSGEDRMAKQLFRETAARRAFSLVTKHPLTPAPAERVSNPRSRSAKLRILERRTAI